MWPFTKEKSSDDIAGELPDNLKQFFNDKNPDKKEAGREAYYQRVQEVLERPQEYSYQFDHYKKEESVQKVTGVNCAEIQNQVVECFKKTGGWSLTTYGHCEQEMKNGSRCADIQKDALKRLHYGDCYSEKQCLQIRRVVDELFVRNFGQFGDNVTEDNQAKFNTELDSVFFKIWR